MRPSIYRITLFLASLFFFQNQILAQSAPPAFSPNEPHCAFDELNHQHPPAIKQQVKEFLENAIPALSSQPRSAVEPLISVAVVVHIIHEGEPVGTGRNLSDARIRAQVEVLNEDFSALNAQFFKTPSQWMGLAGTPNIQFCLASEDPTGNATNGIDRHNLQVTGTSWTNNNINSHIKPQTNWDPTRYFNIYVVSIPGTTSAGGVVGYSNYPVPGLIGQPTDGVVIDYNWFGAQGYGASGWRALTHEAGHYLGLPHTFNGTSCSSDDNIADTPNIDNSTRSYTTLNCASSYPTGPTSCGNAHLYVNYMDYATENCYTSFTHGQANVVRSVLDGTSSGFGYGSRQPLVTNAPLLCDLPAHDAGIVRLLSPSDNYCTSTPVVPQVTLRNFGTENLTSTSIYYQVNGGPLVEYEWQGNLFPGENTDVSLAAFLPPNYEYTLNIFSYEPNGFEDDRSSNDSLVVEQFAYVASAPPMIERFENETGFPTTNGTFSFNITSDDHFWQLSSEASGFGQGQKAAMFDNFAMANDPGTLGSIDALITRHFNLTDVDNAVLYFDVAYAPFSNLQSDTLFVLIATNCSQNFNQLVFKKGGTNLATRSATNQPFTPTPTQWRTEGLDLSSYDGMGNVSIAFVNKSGWGNRLFIDNVKVGRACTSMSLAWDIAPDGCGITCTGSATVAVSNHNGGLNYQWAGWPTNHNLPTVYQLCPGNVAVTVTDALGCQLVASSDIPQAPNPGLTMSSTVVSSFGASDGTATVTVTGTPPFLYAWSNGVQVPSNNFSNTIVNLPKGTYSVTVTDNLDCQSAAQVQVGSVCDVFTLGSPVTHVTCFGGSNGTAMALPQNGTVPYNFTWSNGQNTQSATGLVAGNYAVTVGDANGCSIVKSVTVNQPTKIVLVPNSTNETFNGANDGTANVSASGGSSGYQYAWNTGSNMPVIMDLAPGTYTVTVTDLAGCTATASATVQSYSCDDFTTVISWTNITCFGNDDGTATVTVGGETQPVTYEWSNGDSDPSIENLPPGNYTVTVTDGANCVAELSADVQEPPLLTVTASATDESGPGANDGTAMATAMGGIPPVGTGYSVLWSNGETTFSIENLPAGQYTVTVTDANQCTATATATVGTPNCALSLNTTGNPASCPNVADGLGIVMSVPNGTSPFEYLWSNGDTDLFAENLLPGTYTVTVTDANGCTVVGSVNIVSNDMVPPVVALTIAELQLTANGTATLNPADVDDGSTDNCSMVFFELSQTEFSCDDIGENEIEVTVSDANGNVSIGTTLVIVSDLVPPSIVCPDDITVPDCGEVTYALPTIGDNCGDVDQQIIEGFESGEIFPIGSTTVTWEAYDANGNSAACSFTVTVDYDLEVELLATSPSCTGDSDGFFGVFIAGGMAPYQSIWSHGGGPSDLSAGEYTITVTDQNGCTIVQTAELLDPPLLEPEVLSVTPAMNINSPGSISLAINGGTGPLALTWFDENGNELADFDPSAAPPGTYSVEVEDSEGCTASVEDIFVDNLNAAIDRALDRQVSIFPNPTGGLFFVKISMESPVPAMLALFDVNGKMLLEQTFDISQNKAQPVDMTAFGSGVFWVKMQVGEAVVWRKLVKI